MGERRRSRARQLDWGGWGRRGWHDVLSAWEDFRYEAEDFLELDEERVLVLFRFRGRGKSSGLEIEQMRSKAAQLFDISCGKVARTVLYFDRDRALADIRDPQGSDSA